MGEATAVDAEPHDLGNEVLEELPETRWQRFLRSWWLAGIFASACVLGVLAILGAHPFASASVSKRVSASVGKPASCTEVGATRLDGKQVSIYRCAIGLEKSRLAQCFTVSGGEIRQLGGTRRVGC